MISCLSSFALMGLLCASSFAETSFRVGAAKIDVTPEYPVRLSGFGNRTNESQGVAQRIWAKAFAIEQNGKELALFAAVDNCAISKEIRDEVAQELQRARGLSPERLVIYSTHTHCAPCLHNVLPNLFSSKIASQEQATIDRYTRELVEKLKDVCLDAASHLQSATLYLGQGTATFAHNRRPQGGPVDHDMPVLVARDETGKPIAILANYACHCTTLGGDFNQVHGDWAGFAQAYMERQNPGAVALMSIGCGADSNPMPRGKLQHADDYGAEIARETGALLDSALLKITEPLECRAKLIELPFDPSPTKVEWEERAKTPGIVGHHARVNLERIARGEQLPTALPYMVGEWNFGRQLAMVFLAGEVVVDYSLRLKQEFDRDRLWVNGYANFVPCYIPSVRILNEGGYEAETSLWYYDRPARLSTNTESLIISAVHQLMPQTFAADERVAEFPPAKSPRESLATIRTRPGLTVQLVAAEPLVESPVAIDWDARGNLWVVEMRDFPLGIDGHWKPGGRVKKLEDVDGDGVYDKATVFLEEVPFPTGITAYEDGVLVCAAPDILYAIDRDGDGKADEVKKLFSGFATDNYQARVNSLSLGLDNWIYGANGLIGGIISGGAIKSPINISGRDFRIKVESGIFETAAGITQQGRVRDDWDNWFGCDNSTLAWHYPFLEHYLRRNPNVAAPQPRIHVAADADPNQLYPISRTLKRFNDPQSANRTTSACGLGLYRDTLLGQEFYGNGFTCEPVHNLVHRLVLEPDGITFKGHRAPGEQEREFLAARDNWFRPVQVRTGPDGALWIVDMYRFVVEHPRWITKERLEQLDLRAGAEKGRIYRLFPKGNSPRPIRDLRQLTDEQLARALDNPNGTERDRIQLELLRRNEIGVLPVLTGIAQHSTNPAVRVQALSAIQGVDGVSPSILKLAFDDADSHVRKFALQLCEGILKTGTAPEIAERVLRLAGDSEEIVRYQAAFSLGYWKDARASAALADIAARDGAKPYFRAAILSSCSGRAADVLQILAMKDQENSLSADLISTALASGAAKDRAQVLRFLAPKEGKQLELWQLQGFARYLESGASDRPARLFASAREIARGSEGDPQIRAAAARLLGYDRQNETADAELLRQILQSSSEPPVQNAAIAALARMGGKDAPKVLLRDWTQSTPATRHLLLQAILQKEAWTSELLDHVGQDISPAELTLTEKQRLLKHFNPSIRSKAGSLFASTGTASRQEILKQFEPVLHLSGNAAHGREVFNRVCATCHAFKGQGFAVGPNLAALTDRSSKFLLTAILDPNAAVETRYLSYNVETSDGRSLFGVITDETGNSLTILNAGGIRETVLRSKIQEIRASNLSLMPEGLEQGLSPQDLGDLFAHLQQAPAAFGSATPGQIARARQEWLDLHGPNSYKIKSASELLDYRSWLGTLPLHHCRQTDGKSKVVWEVPAHGHPQPSGRFSFQFPVALGFVSQPSGKFALAINGKPALDFNATTNDEFWQNSDGSVQISYTARERNDEDSDGVFEITIDKSFTDAPKPIEFSVTGSAANSQRWFGIYAFPSQVTQSR